MSTVWISFFVGALIGITTTLAVLYVIDAWRNR